MISAQSQAREGRARLPNCISSIGIPLRFARRAGFSEDAQD